MPPEEARRSPGIATHETEHRRRTDRDVRSREHEHHDHDHDHDQEKEQESSQPPFFQRPLFIYGAIALGILLLVAMVIWWLIARQYETTDDAFIDTHIVHIAPQVPGRISRIYVNDNQLVHRGDPLVEIDSADYNARLQQALAQQVQAETQYSQAIANERGAAAQAVNAAQDLQRYRLLKKINQSAVAQQQMDQAAASARNAIAARDAARAQISGAEAAINVAKAQVAAARLNLGYTHIVAPEDGHVAQRNVALGNYVSAGQELMAIVPIRYWVTANFKETQLAYMRAGQPVTVSVDACLGSDIRGHVDSIQRGAGQAFGILPPENATGNYVKVVQRVPVKIVLDQVPRACPLGPGMSVEPSVKVR